MRKGMWEGKSGIRRCRESEGIRAGFISHLLLQHQQLQYQRRQASTASNGKFLSLYTIVPLVSRRMVALS
jgi:hypothetical protein